MKALYLVVLGGLLIYVLIVAGQDILRAIVDLMNGLMNSIPEGPIMPMPGE